MGTRGHWIRFLAVTAGYAVAFVLFRRVASFSLLSPWFVFVAMICFLGLAAMARPVLPIRIPRGVRTIRPWEAEGSLYRRLGIHAFGRLLRRTPLKLLNTDVYLGGVRSTLKLRDQLEAAEASHFWDAILVAPYMVYLALSGMWTVLLWFSLAQVLVNAYPIMHLRMARHRVTRLARKKLSRRQRG